VGDHVRIELVSPAGIPRAKVREVRVDDPQTEEAILEAIELARYDPQWYVDQAQMMIEFQKNEPPPRRYRGGRVVR
jgi:hypothetical protein